MLEVGFSFVPTNMLEKACSAARGEAEYAYDGLRNRVKRLERDLQAGLDPCAEMRYVLDMTRPYDNLLMTQSADGSMERYTWGNELLGAAGGQESYFYLQDRLHSPIRLVDGGDGQNDTTLAYDEFGVPLISPVAGKSASKDISARMSSSNPFGFTGYQIDSVSGLCYAQARYYSPQDARMIAEDPIRSGLNWYGYCENNPVVFVDKNGMTSDHFAPSLDETVRVGEVVLSDGHLNVREKPGVWRGNEPIHEFRDGDIVTIERSMQLINGKYWLEISSPISPIKGWVSADFVLEKATVGHKCTANECAAPMVFKPGLYHDRMESAVLSHSHGASTAFCWTHRITKLDQWFCSLDPDGHPTIFKLFDQRMPICEYERIPNDLKCIEYESGDCPH